MAAQGLGRRPAGTPTMRTLSRTIERTGVLQVDSVNVFARAHLMPLFSRMGPYDPALLTRAAERRPRRLVEYWAHVQAFMPVELWPVMHHRREEYRANGGKWRPFEAADITASVLAAVAARGPVTARDLEAEFAEGERNRDHWGWNWSLARRALDHLYVIGDVAIAGRNAQFEVRYDLPERVLPEHVLNAPVPTAAEASRELIRRAARSHGVATSRCLVDYYRMRWQPGPGLAGGRTAVAELIEDGELIPVEVEGWGRPAYLHRDARVPRAVPGRALLSPFDPLVWERERLERLFDFHYRIEIYVPAAQRVYGYYVLPFLLDGELVARVDLKADRTSGTLLVRGAWAEDGAPVHTAAELAAELWLAAGWLGLGEVEVAAHGDLAASLAAEVPTAAAGVQPTPDPLAPDR